VSAALGAEDVSTTLRGLFDLSVELSGIAIAERIVYHERKIAEKERASNRAGPTQARASAAWASGFWGKEARADT
jgi:hypothetical protein